MLFAPVGRGNTRHLVTNSGILAKRADRVGLRADAVTPPGDDPDGRIVGPVVEEVA
jgi:hypothetical protein